MIKQYEEEKYLSDVSVERYWLHWEDYETNTGDTIGYFKNRSKGYKNMWACIKENPHLYYYLEDLQTGKEVSSYDPNPY